MGIRTWKKSARDLIRCSGIARIATLRRKHFDPTKKKLKYQSSELPVKLHRLDSRKSLVNSGRVGRILQTQRYLKTPTVYTYGLLREVTSSFLNLRLRAISLNSCCTRYGTQQRRRREEDLKHSRRSRVPLSSIRTPDLLLRALALFVDHAILAAVVGAFAVLPSR